jgi:hypothetical protein
MSKPEQKLNRITDDENLHVSQFFAKPFVVGMLSILFNKN